jgi:hypothetical protein
MKIAFHTANQTHLKRSLPNLFNGFGKGQESGRMPVSENVYHLQFGWQILDSCQF